MAENSNIEWCDHTFNPWRGCTKVSPGCANCYADSLSARNPTTLGKWGPHGTRIVASNAMWQQPVKWNEKVICGQCGYAEVEGSDDCRKCTNELSRENGARRPRVFCASLADIFEDWTKEMRYPGTEEDGSPTTHFAWWNPNRGIIKAGQTQVRLHPEERPATMQDARDQLFKLIETTPNLDWLLLTKRPQNVMRMVPEHWHTQFPNNVWMGTSVEDQNAADTRIPELLKIPAKVRFLSCEPLLAPVDLTRFFWDNGMDRCWPKKQEEAIHWVIAGGESGPEARPMNPDWALSLLDQCADAAAPFLFKQWGEWRHCDEMPAADYADAIRRNCDHQNGSGNGYLKVGKKAAGRLLDGVEHNGYPLTNS